jgi:N-acetylneuraminic acid mutarotase
MHQPRTRLGVAVVNGKIYAIGGNAESGLVGTNEEYDPATDTWTFKTPMPTPRGSFATAVYQNKIYCISGIGDIDEYAGVILSGVNEVYDPVTDTWETKAPMPTPREWVQAKVVNGKMYLIGGIPNGTLNEVYDPATDSWATKAPMPIGAGGYASAVVVDNKIYDLPQIYDSENDTWSVGTASPSGGAAVVTIGVYALKRIYFVGESETQVYDPENDSWAFGATVPTSRSDFAVAVVNDRLYAIGGITVEFAGLSRHVETGEMYITTFYATNEEYTPVGYGTVPPEISVVSPENKNYTSSNVSLAFTLNKPAAWMGYSLDGQENATITGNTTIAGLTNGLHNITVYAKDKFENTGSSETITFTIVKEPEPFPTSWIVTAAVSVAVVGIGLWFTLRKSRKKNKNVKNEAKPFFLWLLGTDSSQLLF